MAWSHARFTDDIAQVLPGSTGYMPDQIAGLRVDGWQPFDLESGDDNSLATDLMARFGSLLGRQLTVVTDASWRPEVGQFTTSADDLPALMREHADRYGEAFFGGDVVIVSSDTGVVIVVHHNGLIQAVRSQPG